MTTLSISFLAGHGNRAVVSGFGVRPCDSSQNTVGGSLSSDANVCMFERGNPVALLDPLGLSTKFNYDALARAFPNYDQYPTEAPPNTATQHPPAAPAVTTIWDFIGGKVKQNFDAGIFTNSCTVRLSYAMNYGGMKIPFHKSGAEQTVSGADKLWYMFRVAGMKSYLTRTLGKPFTLKPDELRKCAGEGIVILNVRVWTDATGHATLWTGAKLIDSPEHNQDYIDKAEDIDFWPASGANAHSEHLTSVAVVVSDITRWTSQMAVLLIDRLLGRYCRKCGYELCGLPEPRCPECGRLFDPANPQTTRARPHGGMGLWVTRAVCLLLGLGLCLGIAWGWLYWGWKAEQSILRRVRATAIVCEPVGGAALQRRLGSSGVILDRVTGIYGFPRATTDLDLTFLEELAGLQELDLSGTLVTDAGLAHLGKLKRLRCLDLSLTQVTDTGLANLAGLPSLRDLDISGTKVSDTGMVQLSGLGQLSLLHLDMTQVSDTGLAALAPLTRLEDLGLARTQVTDDGTVTLKGFPNIRHINLSGTQVSDAGMRDVADCPNLQSLYLGRHRYLRLWTNLSGGP